MLYYTCSITHEFQMDVAKDSNIQSFSAPHMCSGSHNSLRGITHHPSPSPTFCSEAHQPITLTFERSLKRICRIQFLAQKLKTRDKQNIHLHTCSWAVSRQSIEFLAQKVKKDDVHKPKKPSILQCTENIQNLVKRHHS